MRTLRIIVFALFYCLLDLRWGESNVISLYCLCCSVNGSVCLVCCVFDGVYELYALNLIDHWVSHLHTGKIPLIITQKHLII